MKAYHRILAGIFILFVGALALLFVLLPDRSYSASEKRNLEQFPPLNLSTITDGSFMDAMEDYAADQFPFRDRLMTLKTAISRFMGNRESHGVYLAENDTLMELFDTPDEDNLKETADSIKKAAARHADSRFFMLLVPTACAVYPELLPEYAPLADQNAYIDEFTAALGDTVSFIDVRPVFLKNKEDIQLYYRTDHHWTTDAAELAFQESAEAIGLTPLPQFTSAVVSNHFYGSLTSESGFKTASPDAVKVSFPADDDPDFFYTVSYVSEGTRSASCFDSEKLVGDDPYQVFFGGNHPLIEIENSLDDDRSILIIKDSYANCFIPFLLKSYRKITVVDPRYYYDDIDMLMDSNHFTDVLFLYNAATLSTDTSLKTVLKNQQ